jgi:hypothetical protein
MKRLFVFLVLLLLYCVGCARPEPQAPPRLEPKKDFEGLADRVKGEDLRLAQNTAAPGGNPVVKDAPHDNSLLVYTATVTLSVFQVETMLASVEKMGREAGGYLSMRTDQQITIRVPRAKFHAVLGQIEGMGNVLHRDVAAEDVTDQFVDMEVRLKNARAMRERLQTLLQSAQVKEALEIEKELARLTGEIESMEGKLKLLRDRIAYSTITVSFQPLAQQQVRETSLLAPFPFLHRMGLGPLLSVSQ